MRRIAVFASLALIAGVAAAGAYKLSGSDQGMVISPAGVSDDHMALLPDLRGLPVDYAGAVRACASNDYAQGYDPACVNIQVVEQLGLTHPLTRDRESRASVSSGPMLAERQRQSLPDRLDARSRSSPTLLLSG